MSNEKPFQEALLDSILEEYENDQTIDTECTPCPVTLAVPKEKGGTQYE